MKTKIMILIAVLLSSILPTSAAAPVSVLASSDAAVGQPSTTYYVRQDGGTPQQCTGQADAAYSGSGQDQPCAWNHPFQALPPFGQPRIHAGDTLIIGAGSYQMGIGAPATAECEAGGAFDCHMPPIPSGPSPQQPTRILGAGWDSGCTNPPELWGTERPWLVVNLSGTDNAEIACLEITDHSGCVEDHGVGEVACRRDEPPFGKWADTGLYAEDSTNVTLRDLNIHGLAVAGIKAGRLRDWTVEDVRIAANGWVGWEGDIDGADSNEGMLHFKHWTVEWNGCAETWPDEQITDCWAQEGGGYGDGVGTGATQGHWIIEDSEFLYNTSDGLDLLYARPGSQIEITRVRAEGNAGNQIKTSGPVTITNTIVVGNCAYFDGRYFMTSGDICRAAGNAFSVTLWPGDEGSLANNTVTGEGDCLVLVECPEGEICTGSERLSLRNNIFQGHDEFGAGGEKTCLVYAENLAGNVVDAGYNLVVDVKDNDCPGNNNICGQPAGLTNSGVDTFDAHLISTSPAIDAGLPSAAPDDDYAGYARDASPDLGAYEFGASKQTQTITFAMLSSKTVTDAPFSIAGKATADSELPVSFTASGVCTVADSIVTLNGHPGTCTITAHQTGNATYEAAPDVSQSFSVSSQDDDHHLRLPLVLKP